MLRVEARNRPNVHSPEVARRPQLPVESCPKLVHTSTMYFVLRPSYLVPLMLAATAGSAAAQAPMGGQPSVPVIVTQGEATLKRAPDRAWLTVSTEARDIRPAEARRKNAEAMADVQKALGGAGIRADAIRTTGVSLTPEMDWNDGRSTLKGYVARNQIEVRVDDLDTLSAVLDAANSPKGIALAINGPRFDLKDSRQAESEALRAAVEDARERAQAIAAGAGRSLGAILRIDDQQMGAMPKQPMPMMMAQRSQADVATPVTPGEIELHAQVLLTVEMK
jgi:uncharacterized protein YggE